MNKTTMLIKTDKEVKAAAQDAAREIGVPLGTVMGMYLRRFARERRIEFEAPLVPNAKTAKALRRSQKEFEQGKFAGPFSNLDDLFASLTK
ncbi:MAG: type II toxin-antitoxin system RelB/DinJ family antitoxin [Patescibacteria group bacterium]